MKRLKTIILLSAACLMCSCTIQITKVFVGQTYPPSPIAGKPNNSILPYSLPADSVRTEYKLFDDGVRLVPNEGGMHFGTGFIQSPLPWPYSTAPYRGGLIVPNGSDVMPEGWLIK